MSRSVGARLPRGREFLLWCLLGVAASPVLFDTAHHLLVSPWAAYCSVFWILFAREVVRPPSAYQPRTAGWLLVAAGLAIELTMLQAGWLRWGRPGVALSMLGMALGLGHPRPVMAVLAFWTVPLPSVLARLGSPELAMGLFRVAAVPLATLGIPLEVALEPPHTVLASVGTHEMAVLREDGGLTLAALLSGLAWYTGTRGGLRPAARARRLAIWTALALPIQAAAVLAVGGLLGLGHADIARAVLSHGPWVAVTLTVLLARGPADRAT